MKLSFTLLTLFFCYLVNAQKAGTLDSSFGINGKVITKLQNGSLNCEDIVVQKDGKLICTGSGGHDSIGGFAAIKYTTDGMLDSTFGDNGISFINFGIDFQMSYAACIQPDDKIIITGYGIINIFNPSYFILVCRLNPDGRLDSGFGTNGKIISDDGEVANAVSLQPDGKIVVTGNNGVGTVTLRYLSNGSPDQNFGNRGFVSTSLSNASTKTNLVLPDAKILVGGDNFNQLVFVRYNPDGSLDNSFGTNGKLYSNIYKQNEGMADMVLQPDGKILVAAEASLFISDSCMLIRYTPEGILDSIFGTNGIVINKIPYSSIPAAIALQDDGKIILTGGTTGSVSSQHTLVARFNSDGSVDSTFSDSGYQVISIEISDGGKSLVIQKNQKIIIAGNTRDSAGNNGIYLIRYFGNNTKKQNIIKKIKHYTATHNSAQSISLSNVSIYPNPAQNVLHIEGLSSNTKLTVVDVAGNSKLQAIANASSYNLNIASLNTGNYLLKIEMNGAVVTKQFIKQ